MKIGVVDFDARQVGIVEELSKHCLDVSLVTNIQTLSYDFSHLVLPFKGCNEQYLVNFREGCFDLSEYLVHNPNVILIAGLENAWISQLTTNVMYLMNRKDVLKENSELTAQCLLVEILKRIDCNIKQLEVDVLGYGNCGREIVSLLTGLVENIRVIVKKSECSRVSEWDLLNGIEYEDWCNHEPNSLIINTVPTLVITKEIMHRWIKKPFILDIASFPGGVDYDETNLLEINAYLLPSLPSIYVPKTAGKILANAILKELSYE